MDLGNAKRVAIVGSRRRHDRCTVDEVVDSLPAGVTVVSGGCRGVDTWAVEAARRRGLEVIEHLPDLAKVRNRGEAARRYDDRNQVVVDDSDVVLAFVSTDRKGGTEDTIRRADAAGKRVILL